MSGRTAEEERQASLSRLATIKCLRKENFPGEGNPVQYLKRIIEVLKDIKSSWQKMMGTAREFAIKLEALHDVSERDEMEKEKFARSKDIGK